MRTTSIAVCAIALLLSSGAFGVLMSSPELVEKQLRSQILRMLERELSTRAGRPVAAAEASSVLQRELQQRITVLREEIDGTHPDAVALVFAQLCHYACGTPANVAASWRSALHAKVEVLDARIERVRSWANSRYAAVVAELVRELRIFTAINAVLFSLTLIGLCRDTRLRVLGKLSLLVLIATLFSAYCYLVEQDWLLTLVRGEYAGIGYLLSAAAAFTFLVDVVFWRGRITNALLSIGAPPLL